jgi:hypothetical protein
MKSRIDLTVKELNKKYARWQYNFYNSRSRAPFPSDQIEILKMLGVSLGQIDFSTINDIKQYNDKITGRMKIAIQEIKELKNEKISLREFERAKELTKTENEYRAVMNREMCERVFQEVCGFYVFGGNKVGFVYSGVEVCDMILEEEIRKKFPKIKLFRHELIRKSPIEINRKKVITLRQENILKSAA